MKNLKPASEFDAKYQTNLNQLYDFKNGMTSDEVWALCNTIFESQCKSMDTDLATVKPLLDNMYITFPYINLSDLSDIDKLYILAGMASEFNYHDIIHFCIDEARYFSNVEQLRLEKEYDLSFYWVLSPHTINLVKQYFK